MRWDCESVAKRGSRLVGLASMWKRIVATMEAFYWMLEESIR